MGIDITERKKAEKALQLSEERFRSLIESSSDMIIILNGEGTISYGSPSVERILGYKPEEKEWINKSIFDIVHSDDMSKAINAFTHGMQNPGIPQYVEMRARHKDGSCVLVEVVGKNLLEDPSVQGVVVNVRDITERKQAEEELRQSEERYRLLAENASDVIWTTDMNARFTYISPSVTRLRGFSVEEAMAQSISESLTPSSSHTSFCGRDGSGAGGTRRPRCYAHAGVGTKLQRRINCLD